MHISFSVVDNSPTEPKTTLYRAGLVLDPDCRNVHGFYVTLGLVDNGVRSIGDKSFVVIYI